MSENRLFSWKYISDSADSSSPDDWEKNVMKGYSIFDEIVLSRLKSYLQN